MNYGFVRPHSQADVSFRIRNITNYGRIYYGIRSFVWYKLKKTSKIIAFFKEYTIFPYKGFISSVLYRV